MSLLDALDASANLPDPLTPAECDLRGLPFMPLDTIRLLDSDLFALSTGEEFKAALALWCKSWQQVPGGSLPNDERVLAYLSGVGVAVASTVDGSSASTPWERVRSIAMRGWILCSDGRLYHAVVAEKAVEAWAKRGKWRERESGKTERQQRWREKLRILSSRLRAIGVDVPEHPKARDLEALCRRHKVDTNVDGETPTVDAKTTANDRGQGKGKGTDSISPPKGGGAPKRATRLPDDFTMPADWIAAAVARGLSQERAEREAEKFTLHWQAETGRGTAKVDWRKAWGKWFLKELDSPKGRRNFTPGGREYMGV